MLESFLHQLEEGSAEHTDCALCGLEQRQVRRYLEGVANDGVNNIPLRLKLARQGGYCWLHCRQLASSTYLLSAAMLFEDFLKARLRRARDGKRPLVTQCEACQVEMTTRRTLTANLKRHRRSEPLQGRLLETPLCLSHLEIVCPFMPEPTRRQLVTRHEPLLEHLSEVIRKHDYRFTHEKLSPEEAGSLKAFLRLIGDSSNDSRT